MMGVTPQKRDSSLKSFAWKFWWVLFLLFLILIIGVLLFAFIFRSHDASAWGSVIAGVFTYIGTSFLGVFAFFFSWKTGVGEYNDSLPVVNADCIFNASEHRFSGYNPSEKPAKSGITVFGREPSKETSRFSIEITNLGRNAFREIDLHNVLEGANGSCHEVNFSYGKEYDGLVQTSGIVKFNIFVDRSVLDYFPNEKTCILYSCFRIIDDYGRSFVFIVETIVSDFVGINYLFSSLGQDTDVKELCNKMFRQNGGYTYVEKQR